MENERDYYSVLQVSRSASQEDIERAYQRLARAYDPSVSKKRKAELRWQELNAAYETLRDKKSRADYDRGRGARKKPGSALKVEGIETEGGVSAFLAKPQFLAGVGAGVAILIAIVVLVALLGGDGSESAVSQPTVTFVPTPTVPAQTPSVAPATPPEVMGEPVTTASGLQYIDLQEGTGAAPAVGERVIVNYTGWLQADGTKFDSSVERPAPFDFILGTGGVIKGWDEGVATMKVGGKRRLIIPPDLGYGALGSPPTIPENATLVFDVELLDVFKSATPTPTPAASVTPTAEASPTP